MTVGARPEVVRAARRGAKLAAILGGLVGLLVLLGWALGAPGLQAFAPGAQPMVANTALGIILESVVLWLLAGEDGRRSQRLLGRGLAILVTLIFLLTSIEYLSSLDLGIDQFLFHEAVAPAGYPGRPSLTAALSLLLLGLSLLLIEVEGPGRFQPVEWFAGGAVLIALVVLNGYLRGALHLGSISIRHAYYGMGLNTAAVILVLGIGVFCARVEHEGVVAQLTRDTIGGRLARRLIPVVILASQGLGLLLEVGRRAGVYTPTAESAFFVALSSTGGAVVVLGASAWLDRAAEARQRSRVALEQSEARFRGLLELAPDPVVVMDDRGRISFVNAQLEQVFGYAREELLGQPVEVLIPERLREADRVRRVSFMARPEVRHVGAGLDMFGRRKDGSEIPVEMSLGPFWTEQGLVVTIIIRDVTEHRRLAEERERLLARARTAHAEAEAERTLFQIVLDSTPVGVFFAEAGTERMLLNPAARELFGRTGPLRSRREQMAWLRHPDGRPVELEEAPSSRALAGEVVPEEHLVVVRPDGRRIPVLEKAAPVRGPSGEIRGAVVIIQDISERVALERMREEYVGLISHDLRNPLNAVILRSQLLQRALEGRGLEREARGAAAIILSARRMEAMIEELLESTRLESGRVELHERPTALDRLVSEVLETATPPGERARFRLDVLRPLPPVPLDPERIARVLVNFITNALKYSPPGSPVEARVTREGERVVVSVRDHGPGVEPEEVPRLFEKYYRTRKGKQKEGLGLGLYICRLIVEAHGGRVWMENAPGGGAVFSFSLPLAGPPPRGEVLPGPQPEAHPSG